MAERNDLLRQKEKALSELAEARAAMPAHSVRPGQLMRLEAAEERLAEIENLIKQLKD